MTSKSDFLSAIANQSSVSSLLGSSYRPAQGEDRVDLCLDVARALESASLTESEKGRRFQLFLSKHPLSGTDLRSVAQRWESRSSTLRNALVSALPAEDRRLIYGNSGSNETSATVAGNFSKSEFPEMPQSNRTWEGTFAGVLLLATDDQSANVEMLRREKLAPIRIRSLEEFKKAVENDSDICACIVDGSFLKYLSSDDQKELFRRIAEFSTFISVRVHEATLALQMSELKSIFRYHQANPKSPEFGQLTTREDSHIKVSELEHLHGAQLVLQTRNKGIFIPGELQEIELYTLMAAVQKYSSSKTLDAPFALTALKTKFIPGGRTSARIASIQINKAGPPLIAKIDMKDFILDEGRRFFTFISSSDTRLQPTVHIHGSAGVIIFGLVDQQTDALQPAPTLESLLQELWWMETYTYKSQKPNLEADLTTAVCHAAEKLLSLNSGSVPSAKFDNVAEPYMDALKDAESAGLSWGLQSDFEEERKKAEDIFRRLTNKAVVHGDIHLRNVLIRGNQEAYIIDYARSGPGHPATDLVRLELSLFVNAFRPFFGDSDAVLFQQEVNDPNTTRADLFARFPQIASWKVNRVCIVGIVESRNRALEALKQHGGGREDYLAAKCLFAWQALLFKDLQVDLCLAVIKAIRF
jgi:Ternary complex associated domain 9